MKSIQFPESDKKNRYYMEFVREELDNRSETSDCASVWLRTQDTIIYEVEFALYDILSLENIQCNNIREIVRYLVQHSVPLNILQAICKETRIEFKEAQLVLDIYNDPENENTIFPVLYIRVKEYNKYFLDKLDNLEIKYAKEMCGNGYMILVTTDFRIIG